MTHDATGVTEPLAITAVPCGILHPIPARIILLDALRSAVVRPNYSSVSRNLKE